MSCRYRCPLRGVGRMDQIRLYDEDFVAWSKQQAAALRAAARTGSNQLLDWENLAEEIEDLSKREQRELSSRLAVIIEHLVKLDHSAAHDPRNGWRRTIRQERAQIERILEQSPSLKRILLRMITKETKRAADAAIAELDDRHELTDAFRDTL